MLGPLFFLVFMIDIDDDIEKIKIASFADDTRGWEISVNQFIQGELAKMYAWNRRNNAEFNGKKFEQIDYPIDPEAHIHTSYTRPDGNPIGGATTTS